MRPFLPVLCMLLFACRSDEPEASKPVEPAGEDTGDSTRRGGPPPCNDDEGFLAGTITVDGVVEPGTVMDAQWVDGEDVAFVDADADPTDGTYEVCLQRGRWSLNGCTEECCDYAEKNVAAGRSYEIDFDVPARCDTTTDYR